MKYQVIVFLDETRQKSYYHSYVISDDTTLGNIECTELPPYQDINKARACYYSNGSWVYDNEKYLEIVAAIEEEKQAEKEKEEWLASIPNNEALYEMTLASMSAINEIALYIENVINPLNELAELVTKGD